MKSAISKSTVGPAAGVDASLLVAFFWMTGALLSFVAMAVGIRAVGHELSTFEILTWRSLIALALIGAVLAVRGPKLGATRQPRLQIVRNLLHLVGQYCWTLALTILPLGVVTSLEFTGPIWAAILAALILGEQLTRLRLVAVLLGALGVLVILRPGVAAVDPATLLVVAAAALYAYAHIAAKQLVRTDTPLAIVLWMSIVQLPIVALAAWPGWITPSPQHYPWLALLAVGGLGAHYCLSEAFKRADAMTVGRSTSCACR